MSMFIAAFGLGLGMLGLQRRGGGSASPAGRAFAETDYVPTLAL